MSIAIFSIVLIVATIASVFLALFATHGSCWPTPGIERTILLTALSLSVLLTLAAMRFSRRFPRRMVRKDSQPLSRFTKILLTGFMALIFVPAVLAAFIERLYLPMIASWLGGEPFVVNGVYSSEHVTRRKIHEMHISVAGAPLLTLNDRIDFELRGVRRVCKFEIGGVVQLSGVKNSLGYVIRELRGPGCLKPNEKN